MSFTLRKAERRQAKLRIGVNGPSGSGKTYSALLIARGLSDSWDKVAIIDSENGSGELYSHLGDYNVVPLGAPFSPERYIEAIRACETAGMQAVVIDSVSHEWDGVGGILEEADRMGQNIQKWAKLTPRHRKFLEAILQSKCHVITTARKKQDWAIGNDGNGKNKVEKLGLKEVQRDGFEYELTLAFDVDMRHYATASKDRTGLFMDKPDFQITETTGVTLKSWAESGAEAELPPSNQSESLSENESKQLKSRIIHNLKRLNVYTFPTTASNDEIRSYVAETVQTLTDLELKDENLEIILKKLERMNLGAEDDQFTLSKVRKFQSREDLEKTDPFVETPAQDQPNEEPKEEPKQPEAKKVPEILGDPWVTISQEDIQVIRDLATDVDWVANNDDDALLAYINSELKINKPSLNQITKNQGRELVRKLLDKKNAQNEKEK